MRIRLRLNGPLSVPVAYHRILQRTLYALFREDDVGAWHDPHQFRPFTFSRLLGRARVVGHQITFPGPIDWWLSFRQVEHGRAVLAQVQTHPVLTVGTQSLPITEIAVEAPLSWSHDVMGVTTLSPIVADDNVAGRIVSYAPDDPAFVEHIGHNAQAKALQFLGRPVAAVTITPLETQLVRSWYGTTPVIGYRGRFLLGGEPAALELLYDIGIGRRNGLGFGCCYAFLPGSGERPVPHA